MPFNSICLQWAVSVQDSQNVYPRYKCDLAKDMSLSQENLKLYVA